MNPTPPNPYLMHDGAPAAVDSSGHAYDGPHAREPVLDDSVPILRNAETQRVNRKALMFLGGIVGLLVLMAAWMFARATDRDARQAIRPSGETVRIPELPQAAAAAPAVEPVPLAEPQYAASPELPPLPPEPQPAPAYGPQPSGYAPSPEPPRPPSLLERRKGATSAEGGPATAQDAYTQAMLASLQAAGPAKSPVADASPTRSRDGARYILNPDALLVRGTYVRCVLETRIVTDVPGFASCVVTEPVYSINGRTLLLPKGSKVLGRYDNDRDGPRVAVVWDRITTPNGIDMNMASPGVDGLGSAGHPGHYDAHWPSRIASALLVSLIADGFGYAAAKHGPPTTYTNGQLVVEAPFESKTAQSMEKLAQQAIAAGGRRPPTVTIVQGTVVNVYVARDIDFSSVVARR